MGNEAIRVAFSIAVAALLVGSAAAAQPFPQPFQRAAGEPSTGSAAQPGPGASGGASLSIGSSGIQTSGSASSIGVDQASTEAAETEGKDDEPEKLRWRETTFTFGQDTSAQTVGIGKDYQSRNPFYEIAFRFSPRYYLLDGKSHTIHINAAIGLSQELTNSDTTTREREVVFDNITLNGVWGWTIYKNEKGWNTSISAGPRVIFPTAKVAWRSGQRLQLGVGLQANQKMPFAGPEATWFPGAGIGGSIYYIKPFSTAQVDVNPDFERERQGIDGMSIRSNQISASARTNHQLSAELNGSVDILQKLHFGLSYIWRMQWAYTFGQVNVSSTGVPGSSYPAKQLEDATNFRVMPWFTASLDYDLLPEVGLGIGYYNQTNALGEDGRRRNSLWSYDAHLFFDITANLDQIYLTAAGKRTKKDAAKSNVRARREARAKSAMNWMAF